MEQITDLKYKMEVLELSVGSTQNSTTESTEAASAKFNPVQVHLSGKL